MSLPFTHKTLREFGLLPYQAEFLLQPDRFKFGLWSRQTGKDYTCAAEAVLDCYSRPGVHWLILAASERQSLETLRKAESWSRRVRAWLATGLGEERTTCPAISRHEIVFPFGSRITALPSKPSTVRGFSANLILSEFAFHDDPEELWKAVFPMLTHTPAGQEKKLRIITTPNGQGTFFHRLWEEWTFHKQRVTIQQAAGQGLPVDIGLLRRGMNDPEAWMQEYECQFTDTISVLLPYELIHSCVAREATLSSSPGLLAANRSELFMGIDVGRKHDLTVCWILERAGGKLSTREILVLDRMPFPAQLAQLAPRVRLARRICIDATGMGIGLADALEPYAASRLEKCSFTPSLKEDLFPRLRSAFERGALVIPNDRTVVDDLHSVRRTVTREGRVSYRAGDSPDGHSDRCTALALALRAADTAPAVVRPTVVGEPMMLLR